MKYILLILIALNLNAAIKIEPKSINEINGTKIDVGADFLYSTGNTEKMVLSTSGKLTYGNGETYNHLILFSVAYGEVSNNKDTNNNLIHYRYAHKLNNQNYEYELFTQDEFNEFTSTKIRFLAGANIRKRINYFDRLFLGIGAFYSYMEPIEINNIDKIKKRVKGNFYLLTTHKFNENFDFTYLGFYQPNVVDISDFTFFNYIQFNSKLTTNLVFNININAFYNSTPYENVEKDDVKVLAGISYSFN